MWKNIRELIRNSHGRQSISSLIRRDSPKKLNKPRTAARFCPLTEKEQRHLDVCLELERWLTDTQLSSLGSSPAMKFGLMAKIQRQNKGRCSGRTRNHQDQVRCSRSRIQQKACSSGSPPSRSRTSLTEIVFLPAVQ